MLDKQDYIHELKLNGSLYTVQVCGKKFKTLEEAEKYVSNNYGYRDKDELGDLCRDFINHPEE